MWQRAILKGLATLANWAVKRAVPSIPAAFTTNTINNAVEYGLSKLADENNQVYGIPKEYLDAAVSLLDTRLVRAGYRAALTKGLVNPNKKGVARNFAKLYYNPSKVVTEVFNVPEYAVALKKAKEDYNDVVWTGSKGTYRYNPFEKVAADFINRAETVGNTVEDFTNPANIVEATKTFDIGE